MTLGTGSEVAHIPCPSGSVGDVSITCDGEEFTVNFEGMTHGHFTDYDGETDIVVDCCDFLDDLFHDRVVVWVQTGWRRWGGWLYVEHLDPLQLPLRTRPERVRMGTWSAPMSRHPPDADDLNPPPSR